MAYSVIPLIALVVHALINYDVFTPFNPLATKRSYRSYRFFIICTLAFYLVDACWGLFDTYNLVYPSYVVTYLFFFLMAVTIFSWIRYVVAYLENRDIFLKIAKIIGWVFAFGVIGLLIANSFYPIFFEFTPEGTYVPKIGRQIFFYVQAGLFGLSSIYTFIFAFVTKDKNLFSKCLAIAIFGGVMALSIGAQIAYPQLPIYSGGLLVGLTIVRIFIANEERKDFARDIKDYRERMSMQETELSTAKELVNLDSLTGVKSRYAYVKLEEDIDNLIANNEIDAFSVIVVDLNDLKFINDKLGHDEGDRYLKDSVAFIQAFFPGVDLYRIGGDEFVLFIKDRLYNERASILEAFNKKVEENLETGEPILAAGLADFLKERDNTYRSVFERADERMYDRKERLKEKGEINITKFARTKYQDADTETINNIVLKAKDTAHRHDDSRLAFYKTFYYNERLSLIDLLNNSSCDEIMEVNYNNDTFKNIYHVDGKYFVPTVEFSFKDLYDFVLEHIVHPDDRESYIRLMNSDGIFERLKNNEIPNFDYGHFRYRLQDGEYRFVEQVIITGKENGIPEGFIRIYVFDIHNFKTRQLGYAADERNVISKGRDQVTSLLLEKEFMKKAQELIDEKPDINWCLISIDIENFTFFDEWYGRETGDYLLAKIGATLFETENELGGVSGYFGKDDFGLLMPYDEQKIKDLYEKLRQIILSFGLSVGFMPALGVALIEKDLSVMDAFDRSTIAATKAKSDIRHRICVYDTEMQFLAMKEYRLLSEYMSAFKNDEITFYLQPQCRISSKKIVGAEALARWIKKDGTIVSPADYIPVLEKYGFITDLDQYLWEKVCKWIKKRLDANLPVIPISVNVSRADIFAIDIPKAFDDLTRKYDIPHKLLKIEITESSYAENTEQIDNLVTQLKEKGFMVLMDDFGNGYSSLNMLSNIKIDAIKLDAKFLHIEGEDAEKGIRILEAVVNMAKLIALPIVVEGVETKSQCDFLEGMGCRYIQGFFFYKPMPVGGLEALIQDREMIDERGFVVKPNEQLRIREFLDRNIYSDSMLNNIIGPVAFYSWNGVDKTDIVRFNEQFYKVVAVSDFAERLDNIERFLVKEDHAVMHGAFKKAMENRLNGYVARLRFFRSDGSLSCFNIHFYYLGKKEGGERFYGSAVDVTELTCLKEQIGIIAKHSHDNMIFVSKTNNKWHFTVASHGLSDIFDISPDILEKEMNGETTAKRFVHPEDFNVLMSEMERCYKKKESFTRDFDFYTPKRYIVTLRLTFTPVGEENSNIDYIINSTVVK